MFNITLAEGYSIKTMLAVGAIAILLTATFYYRAFSTLERRQWQTLLGLRIFSIVLIVLLLFQPVFSYQKDLEEQPGLVFLLDTSSSMSISDGASGVTRFNLARQQVEQWCEKLQNDFRLKVVAFSERAKPLDDILQLPTLAPNGKATSLSRALVAAIKTLPREDIEAVILLSDGVHNSARNPLQVANKMGVVVHTVGVGASLRSDVSYRDIQIIGMDCPDRMMLNNRAHIKASIEGIGLTGHVTKIILEDDGKQIAEQELTLDEIEGSQEVTFEFRPTVKGRHTYTIKAEPAGSEKITQNNQRSAISLVVESGLKVLYIEGTLRAEYGAIMSRFLAKDPDIEFCALVQTRPNVFLRRTNIEDLKLKAIPKTEEEFNAFDVFIIGDLDSSYFQPEQQELLVKRIRDGAGLVMLGGYHSLGPGGYAHTPLGKILPVRLGSRDVGQITDLFLPMLTPDGNKHHIFVNINSFFPTKNAEPKITGLPELEGCTRVLDARPGATVLAICPIDPKQMPVLAVQQVGNGQTAVFCGDTTRNWQQASKALDRESPFLQFWGQMVRWLAGRSKTVTTEAGVVGSTDKGYYEPEETIRISAVVRNSEGQGTDKAEVVAKIKNPAGRADEIKLSVVPGPGGHFSGTLEPKAAGTYEIEIHAKVDDKSLTATKIAVEVGRPNLEFEKLDLDDKMLGQIASDTGGRYVHITTAGHLIDQLDRTQRKKRLYLEKPLFWPPLFWLLFVGSLTTEWILRKRYQLR